MDSWSVQFRRGEMKWKEGRKKKESKATRTICRGLASVQMAKFEQFNLCRFSRRFDLFGMSLTQIRSIWLICQPNEDKYVFWRICYSLAFILILFYFIVVK